MQREAKIHSNSGTRRHFHGEGGAKKMPDRRSFLAYFSGLGLGATLFPGVLWGKLQEQKPAPVTKEMLREAAATAGSHSRIRNSTEWLRA